MLNCFIKFTVETLYITWIKVCGVSDREEADVLERLGIDAAGFVIGGNNLTCEFKHDLSEYLESFRMEKVLVTHWTMCEDVLQLVSRYPFDMVQFAEEIPLSLLEKVRDMGVEIIKTVPATYWDEMKRVIDVYTDTVDYFLTDTVVGNKIGGTGVRHDIELDKKAREYSKRHIVESVKPFGVDVLSGVRRKCKLDKDKLVRFVYSARRRTL